MTAVTGSGITGRDIELRESIVSTVGLERDQATGRPLGSAHDLTDEQLAVELMVAAMARDHRRIDRYRALLGRPSGRASSRTHRQIHLEAPEDAKSGRPARYPLAEPP